MIISFNNRNQVKAMSAKLLSVRNVLIHTVCCLSFLQAKAAMSDKFMYFAYGSNLLAQRIHINNPSAVRAGIGKLSDYRLDFVRYTPTWKGAAATIVPTPGHHVWGALWEMDNADMENLDIQEGVADKVYYPLEVEVTTPEGKTVKARTYRETAQIEEYVDLASLPEDRRPSTVYLKTILKGANESSLPKDYQLFLKTIRDNGYMGDVTVGDLDL